MRRRDLLALGVFWALLLAGLAWSLSTQSRWVRENKPIQARPPALFQDGTAPTEASPGVRMIGPITDETRVALRRGLRPQKPPPGAGPAPTRPTPPDPGPR
jgi:hypothetical protein